MTTMIARDENTASAPTVRWPNLLRRNLSGANLWRKAAAPAPETRAFDCIGALGGAVALGLWAMATMSEPSATGQSAASEGSGTETHRATQAPEWQNGGYFGIPYTYPSDIRFEKLGATDLTVHGVHWDGKPFKSPIYYGLRSIRWNGRQGTMVDFTHSKAIAQPDQSISFSGTRNGRPAGPPAATGATFRHLEFSHGHNMLTLNRLFRLGQITPAILPYVGAGFGASLPHTEIQFTDEEKRTYEYQYAGPVGQVVAGFEIRLPRMSVFIEYKFSLARYAVPLTLNDSKGWGYGDFPRQLALWFRGEKPANGTATTILASHQVISGLAVRTPVIAIVP